MVAAIWRPKAPPQHRRAIHGKILIHPGPQRALLDPLRLLTRIPPVPARNAVRGVEGPSSVSPESLQSMRPLPHYLSPARIAIGALSARSNGNTLLATDGRDI